MTVDETHSRVLAAQIAPELLRRQPSENERAQGKPDAQCTRSLARNKKSARASSPQVHRNSLSAKTAALGNAQERLHAIERTRLIVKFCLIAH
jgi:hypothetical protein